MRGSGAEPSKTTWIWYLSVYVIKRKIVHILKENTEARFRCITTVRLCIQDDYIRIFQVIFYTMLNSRAGTASAHARNARLRNESTYWRATFLTIISIIQSHEKSQKNIFKWINTTCPLCPKVFQIACFIRWIPFWWVNRVIIPTKGSSALFNPSLCCNASLAALLPSTTFSEVYDTCNDK